MTHFIRSLIFASLIFTGASYADIGILLPGDAEEPDPSVLTLDEVRVQIRVDHQHARVRIIQIFGNHTGNRLEGRYVFAIPGGGSISDFAVWDGVVRIPGVILERKRASEIYEQLKMQEIDPGLLEQEEGAEGARMAAVFSARIVPIMPYATKRLEMEYTQRLPVEGLKSYFSLPLKPDLFQEQVVGNFSVTLEVLSSFPIADFEFVNDTYPLQFDAKEPGRIHATFQGTNVNLTDDLAFQYRLDQKQSDLSFLAFRGSEKSLRKDGQPITAFEAPSSTVKEDGYFWTAALFNEKHAQVAPELSRSLTILLDTSSSMRWEKLEQAYGVLDYFLHNLPEKDEYQLILFHQEAIAETPKHVRATKENVEKSLAFVKSQYLMGGTDFSKALQQALAGASSMSNQDRYLVMITDGNPTLTQIQTRKLAEEFTQANQTAKMRAFCFGIGSDANQFLLSQIATSSNGVFDWVNESEDLTFKLQAFFAKIGQYPITGLTLKTSTPDSVYNVYPAEPSQAYDGSAHDWFGRYKTPAQNVTLTVNGNWSNKPVALNKQVNFPEEAVEHDFIPRGWARMRVDFLLRKIDLEGEDDKLIDEIIRLAKRYKFVTPYTSFLAAPRSLLRPRVIRPGDPLLRVKTDPEIVAVTAIFPFGLIKNLEYLQTEDIWQTRFLVPKQMADGTYHCRLVLRDRSGNQYEEKKSFLVDSRPPIFRARWNGRFERGRSVKIVIAADKDTRSLYARLEGQPPVRIQWSAKEKASIGFINVPADMPAGVYRFQITGEDFAHNISRWTKKVEVL